MCMPTVLSSHLSNSPAGFKQGVTVMDSGGIKYSILYTNDDGTMAIKSHKSLQTHWRVLCTDYALVNKPPAPHWPPPIPAAVGGTSTSRFNRKRAGLGE